MYGGTEDQYWTDLLDSIISIIGSVQWEDGYIFTYDAIQKKNRGNSEALAKDLNFEVYYMEHRMSAGAVQYKTSGKTNLINLSENAAVYLSSHFSSIDNSTARTAICPSHYISQAPALYNSILSGINIEGDRYFYTNALHSLKNLPYPLKWSRHLESYITSFYCPPNVVRTIACTSDLIC